jgi:hypothetical protein
MRCRPWYPGEPAREPHAAREWVDDDHQAGRSGTAALTKAPHQLHGGRRAHVEAQGYLPDGGSACHRTHDPLTQVSGQRSWHGMPPDRPQPTLWNQLCRFHATAARSNMPERGIAYNAAADRRSWISVQHFLGQVLGAPMAATPTG